MFAPIQILEVLYLEIMEISNQVVCLEKDFQIRVRFNHQVVYLEMDHQRMNQFNHQVVCLKMDHQRVNQFNHQVINRIINPVVLLFIPLLYLRSVKRMNYQVRSFNQLQ